MQEKRTGLKILFCVLWGTILIWRLYIYLTYSVNYTDDDQALVWYATVLFAHGHFPEPCFFGQDYGVMLEALLSVPLFWLGWPLNYALPFTTLVFSVLPYLICSLWLWIRKKENRAVIVMIIPLCLSWQMDVICTMPRFFICGYAFATLGMILFCDGTAGPGRSFLGALLTSVGYVINPSVIAFLCMISLYVLLFFKEQKKKILPMTGGFAIGAFLRFLCLLFYKIHPENKLYWSISRELSLNAFKLNIGRGPTLLNDFFAIPKCGVVFIPVIIAGIVAYYGYKKCYKAMIMWLALVLGVLLLLFMNKLGEFMPDSLVYSQSRFFVFVGYLLATVFVVVSFFEESTEKLEQTRYWVIVFCFVCLFLTICRFILFNISLADEDSYLYHDSATDHSGLSVGLLPVKDLMDQAEIINMLALQNNVVAVALRNGVTCDPYTKAVRLPYKSLAYVCDSVYYSEPYEFCLPVYDRRTWVYQDMDKVKTGNMLLIRYPVKTEDDVMLVELNEQSPIDWFASNFGMHRSWLDYPVGEF